MTAVWFRLSRRITHNLIVVCVSGIHLTWAVCILVGEPIGSSGSAGNITAMHSMSLGLGGGLPYMLMMVSLFALGPLVFPVHSRSRIILMVPQQLFLTVAAFTVVGAMLAGHFGDGVPRPASFIVADQAHIVYLAVIHTVAIIRRSLV
jgi:hypothetical protein